MKHRTVYRLVSSPHPEELSGLLTLMSEEGYMPSGERQAHCVEGVLHHSQMMVKIEEIQPEQAQ
jgi:hypothetical protein